MATGGESADMFTQPNFGGEGADSRVKNSTGSSRRQTRNPAGGNANIATDDGISSGSNEFGDTTNVTPAAAPSWARGPVPVDSRKYRYDVYLARTTHVDFGVTRDDRMSAEEAGAMLDRIHKMFRLDREVEHRILAFDRALFFCHTVNSASTLQPGATRLIVDGNEFDFGEIVRALGNSIRRFFRAFADDIAAVNKSILDSYDPYDAASAERVGWINQIALERGLQRYPYLCHDSADACVKLTPAERAAVVASKREVLNTTINSVDSMVANPRVMSANRYDSTNHTVV